MSLFNEEEKKELNKNLVQLGGGAVGSGVGLLASIPLNRQHEKRLIQSGKNVTSEIGDSIENWKLAMEYFEGNITAEGLGNDRELIEEIVKENYDDLEFFSKNPHKFREYLRNSNKGSLVRFPHKERVNNMFNNFSLEDLKNKRVIPLFGGQGGELSKRKIHNVNHPLSKLLPGGLGLAGMMAGGHYAKKHLGLSTDLKDKVDELNKRIEQLEGTNE